MKNKAVFTTVFAVALVATVAVHAKGAKETPSQANANAPAADPQSSVKSFVAGELPARFASLTVKEGGTCYLDAINSQPPGQITNAKSGSNTSFVGWAVADVKKGKLGTGLGIQLKGNTSYSANADSYSRPPLGEALGHPKILDGGGLKVESIGLPVSRGQFQIYFLIQDGKGVLRCDTGHKLNIE
jgi:hypothetical protein